MFKVQYLTANAKQKQTLIMPDGNKIFIEIFYSSLQLGWFISELTYNDFTVKGVRICNSANLLYQFQNQIPFGLACFSPSQREPMLIDDFFSEASILYVLTQEECEQYRDYINA